MEKGECKGVLENVETLKTVCDRDNRGTNMQDKHLNNCAIYPLVAHSMGLAEMHARRTEARTQLLLKRIFPCYKHLMGSQSLFA